MVEKREFIRLSTNIKVKYKILSRGKKKEALSKDISGGGIKLFLNEKLEIHTLLRLELKIPKHPGLISAEGIIVWVEKSKIIPKFNTGIKFTKIKPISKARIFKYVYENIY